MTSPSSPSVVCIPLAPNRFGTESGGRRAGGGSGGSSPPCQAPSSSALCVAKPRNRSRVDGSRSISSATAPATAATSSSVPTRTSSSGTSGSSQVCSSSCASSTDWRSGVTCDAIAAHTPGGIGCAESVTARPDTRAVMRLDSMRNSETVSDTSWCLTPSGSAATNALAHGPFMRPRPPPRPRARARRRRGSRRGRGRRASRRSSPPSPSRRARASTRAAGRCGPRASRR